MKFKDKDGNVFEDIRPVGDSFCKKRNCSRCNVGKAAGGVRMTCWGWMTRYPTEAARLMGYEVVED